MRGDLNRGAIVAELSRLSEGLMFGSDPAHLEPETQRALVKACFRLWDERSMILRYASEEDASWEDQIRSDLRDIVLRGIEIDRRLIALGIEPAGRIPMQERLEQLKEFGAPTELLELEENPTPQAIEKRESELPTPHSAAEARQYGRAYWSSNRPDEAARYFRLGIEMNPRDLALYFDQASLAFERGRFDTALASYTACLALHPAPTIYSRRGFVYLALADATSATATRELLRWDWNHGIEQSSQARRYLTYANRDFDKAVTDKPSHAEARFGRAQVSLRSQKFSEAIADFTCALDNHYPAARALHGLAVAQLKEGLRESARANLLQSLKHSTNQEVQNLLEQLDQLTDATENPELPMDRARGTHP